jgi:hypothetical protein
MEDFDYDDGPEPPYADPRIRRDYAAALGRLILAHSEVDYRLSALLGMAARRLDPSGGLDGLTEGSFHQRATNIELLMKAVPQARLGGVGNGRLVELNRIRNAVAHGHFDQDPFQDDYEIVERAWRVGAKEKRREYPTERLEEAASELEKIAHHMSAVEAFYDIPLLGR